MIKYRTCRNSLSLLLSIRSDISARYCLNVDLYSNKTIFKKKGTRSLAYLWISVVLIVHASCINSISLIFQMCTFFMLTTISFYTFIRMITWRLQKVGAYLYMRWYWTKCKSECFRQLDSPFWSVQRKESVLKPWQIQILSMIMWKIIMISTKVRF